MARRHEVRLGDRVEPRRSTRAVDGDVVVGAHDGVVRVGRADGDRRWRVAWRRDAGIPRGAVGPLAVVPRRRHDDDAGGARLFDGLHERVVRRRRVNRVSERQVDDLHAERGAVGDHELDGGDDVARPAGAVGVEHLQADEAGAGRDAPQTAPRTRDDPGHVRPVPVLVFAGAVRPGEVEGCPDLPAQRVVV